MRKGRNGKRKEKEDHSSKRICHAQTWVSTKKQRHQIC
jgi:hypothetical protein